MIEQFYLTTDGNLIGTIPPGLGGPVSRGNEDVL